MGVLTTCRRTREAGQTKREQHNARLEAQAKSSKKKRKLSSVSGSDEDNSGGVDETFPEAGDETTSTRKISRKRALPDRLPDDILASEPTITLPPMILDTDQQSKKHKRFLDTELKAPKDVKVGKKRIRVLPSEEKALAPKSNARSKVIREAWLAGRRGAKGEYVVPRKQTRRGFLVKK